MNTLSKNTMPKLIANIIFIPFILIFLASCGGGSSNKTTETTNRAPSASFTSTPNPAEVGESVSFNGSGSSDPDAGDTLTYSWAFGDGGTSQSQSPSHTYNAADTYQVSLTVTDNSGLASAAFRVNVTVNEVAGSNRAPTASFTITPNPAEIDQQVNFDSSGSSDPDVGDTLTYAWTFGDGTSNQTANPAHVYTAAGVYQVTLTVTDNNGLDSSPFQASVTVNDNSSGNNPPTASFTATPNPTEVNSTVNFDSSASNDPDVGDTLTYAWTFGDGTSSQLENPTHSYSAIGSYSVDLIVTDNQGAASSAFTLSITVNEAGQYSGVPEAWPETRDLNVIWFGASTTVHAGSSSTPTYNIPSMVRDIYEESLSNGDVNSGVYDINTDGGTSLGTWLTRSAFNAVESGPGNGGNWDYVVSTAVKSLDPAQFPSDGSLSVYDALERTVNSTRADVFVNYPVPRLNGRFGNDIDSEALLTRYECIHTLARAAGPDILNMPTSIAMDTVYQSLPDANLIARLKTYPNFPQSFPDNYAENANIFIFDVSGFSVDPEHYAQPGAFFVANVFAVYLYGINPIGQPLPNFEGFCATSPDATLCSISDNKRVFLQAVAYDAAVRYRLGERPVRNGEDLTCDAGDQLTIEGQREDAYLLGRF